MQKNMRYALCVEIRALIIINNVRNKQSACLSFLVTSFQSNLVHPDEFENLSKISYATLMWVS